MGLDPKPVASPTVSRTSWCLTRAAFLWTACTAPGSYEHAPVQLSARADAPCWQDPVPIPVRSSDGVLPCEWGWVNAASSGMPDPQAQRRLLPDQRQTLAAQSGLRSALSHRFGRRMGARPLLRVLVRPAARGAWTWVRYRGYLHSSYFFNQLCAQTIHTRTGTPGRRIDPTQGVACRSTFDFTVGR